MAKFNQSNGGRHMSETKVFKTAGGKVRVSDRDGKVFLGVTKGPYTADIFFDFESTNDWPAIDEVIRELMAASNRQRGGAA